MTFFSSTKIRLRRTEILKMGDEGGGDVRHEICISASPMPLKAILSFTMKPPPQSFPPPPTHAPSDNAHATDACRVRTFASNQILRTKLRESIVRLYRVIQKEWKREKEVKKKEMFCFFITVEKTWIPETRFARAKKNNLKWTNVFKFCSIFFQIILCMKCNIKLHARYTTIQWNVEIIV